MKDVLDLSSRRSVDQPARRAARALSKDKPTPPAEVIESLYDLALSDAVEEKTMVTIPYDPGGDVPSNVGLLPMALKRKNIDLALLPENRVLFANLDSIGRLLRHDPDIRAQTDWAVLVYTLVLYNCRVARMSLQAGNVELDVHPRQPTLAEAVSEGESPGDEQRRFAAALLAMLVYDLAAWFGWMDLSGWRLPATIGIALLTAMALFFWGRPIGLGNIGAGLTATATFLSYLAVLWVKGLL